MTKTAPISSSIRTRRQYFPEFKSQVIAQCQHPGVSVASIAREHGINDNLVHKWLRQQPSFVSKRQKSLSVAQVQTPPEFIPVAVMSSESVDAYPDAYNPTSQTISEAHFSINLTLGKLSITVDWPINELAHSTLWLKKLSQ